MAHIMIIDDDQWVRVILRHFLEIAGHTVAEAQDGNAGLELVRKRLPDLIITDIKMPEKDGWETIAGLSKEFPELKVIAMSGGAEFQTRFNLTLGERLGAHRIFTKPIHREKLLAVVSELVGGR